MWIPATEITRDLYFAKEDAIWNQRYVALDLPRQMPDSTIHVYVQSTTTARKFPLTLRADELVEIRDEDAK